MDWAGWALFGLVATTGLTAPLITAQLVWLTRLDLPLTLGTIATEDPDRARVVGFFAHLPEAWLALDRAHLDDAGAGARSATPSATRLRSWAPTLSATSTPVPPGTEGAFVPCSFWLAQALAASGRGEEAQDIFADTVAFGTPLGLFAEAIDPGSRAHCGNFP